MVRRIHDAYPNWKPRPKRLVAELRLARTAYNKALKELKQEKKQALKEGWEDINMYKTVDYEYWLTRIEAAKEKCKATKAKLLRIEKKLFLKEDDWK